MEWMVMPYRRYADFSGRSGQREFWMFMLFTVLVYAVIGGIAMSMFIANAAAAENGAPRSPSVIGIAAVGLLFVFGLVTFIPSLAVQARRFHDQDKSGWMLLISLVPWVGGIIVLIFMMLQGTRGPNRFGLIHAIPTMPTCSVERSFRHVDLDVDALSPLCRIHRPIAAT